MVGGYPKTVQQASKRGGSRLLDCDTGIEVRCV